MSQQSTIVPALPTQLVERNFVSISKTSLLKISVDTMLEINLEEQARQAMCMCFFLQASIPHMERQILARSNSTFDWASARGLHFQRIPFK